MKKIIGNGPLAKLFANPNATSYYRQSKAQNKFFIIEPGWDVAQDSLLMQEIENERRNERLLYAQQRLRDQAKVGAKQGKKRIEKVRQQQAEMRQKFIESSDFIRECNAKAKRAAQQIDEEARIERQLDEEITQLEAKIDKLTGFHGRFRSAITDLQPYEDMLDEVVDRMDLFKSKQDLLNRCDALSLVQSEVTHNDENALQSMDDMLADIVKTSNEASSLIAGLENELSCVEKSYEQQRQQCLKLEDVLASTKNAVVEKQRQAFMHLDEIQQLSALLCKRNGNDPKFKRDQVEQQLDFIKDEIETIQEIIDLANEMMANETRSDIAEDGSGKSGKARK